MRDELLRHRACGRSPSWRFRCALAGDDGLDGKSDSRTTEKECVVGTEEGRKSLSDFTRMSYASKDESS